MSRSILSHLKDFQLNTVDYVFDRLYGDCEPTRRFLIADEVGLGKTLVARGIVERAYAHMQHKVERFNVVYICSNAAIASQNLNRLNVTDQPEQEFATRLTFLPMQIRHISQNKINFISFTPGTTFNLKRRGGTMRERAIIYKMLKGSEWDQGRGLLNLLQGHVGRDNWRWWARTWTVQLDGQLKAEFLGRLAGDEQLKQRLDECCFLYRRSWRRQRPWAHRNQAFELIGDLRQLLAEVCVKSLQPDLVILDEFQRFKDLLDGEDETALLARSLFQFPGVRTLLLSATPYRMLTLDVEETDDHYEDLLRTLRFLTEDEDLSEVKRLIRTYRSGMFSLAEPGQQRRLGRVRDRLERYLLKVMCRTERVAITRRHDAMLSHVPIECPLDPADLIQAAESDAVARAADVPELLEYWKSSPYLLSFMRDYQIGRRISATAQTPAEDLLSALTGAGSSLLPRSVVQDYGQLDPGNGRMRSLFHDTLDRGLWRLLWLPPSLPYSEPAGYYSGLNTTTKALVFSSWSMVPNAIASVCSYEAERRMLEEFGRNLGYRDLYDTLRPLLRFTVDSTDGHRLTGMPALIWMLPSPTLARAVDPLDIALRVGQGRQVKVDTLVEQARLKCEALLESLPCSVAVGRDDERWYWAAPAMLETSKRSRDWLCSSSGWASAAPDRDQGSRFAEHIAQLHLVSVDGLDEAGPRPSDLAEVVALLALAGPGNCALRALMRIAPDLDPDDPELLSAAANIAAGFRTLFNLPESIGLLRAGLEDEYYWRLSLKYCLDGNLQAVLDEQCHVLVDSLGVTGQDPTRRVREVAGSIASALSIRSARVQVGEYLVQDGKLETKDFNIRSRFALRFGELRDDQGNTLARADVVRDAFNSPFRPFVLATTSIGQEGLDFHTWCHSVMHWNLPANPVDLEQREGRVHRYKGHAIRKNVAEKYGLGGLQDWERSGDPWHHLFEKARTERPKGSTDLIPYWVYEEGSARIERRVPMYPMSREAGRLQGLLRALAFYRLVFGQPRQEDLLQHLLDHPVNSRKPVAELAVNLQPRCPGSPATATEP